MLSLRRSLLLPLVVLCADRALGGMAVKWGGDRACGESQSIVPLCKLEKAPLPATALQVVQPSEQSGSRTQYLSSSHPSKCPSAEQVPNIHEVLGVITNLMTSFQSSVTNPLQASGSIQLLPWP